MSPGRNNVADTVALQFGDFFNIFTHHIKICECWVVCSHMNVCCSLFCDV